MSLARAALFFLLPFSSAFAAAPVPADFGATACYPRTEIPLRPDMERALTPSDFGAATAQVDGILRDIRGDRSAADVCQNPTAVHELNQRANRIAVGANLIDEKFFHQPDYWQTPAELLSLKNGWGRFGDCEDFALLKYWMLRRLGCAAEGLHIVVLRDSPTSWHAVLNVHVPGAGGLVLDSQRGQAPKRWSETPYARFGKPGYVINEDKTRWVCF